MNEPADLVKNASEEILHIPVRVQNGIRWLDSRNPNWRTQIDVRTFHSFSSQFCILSQLYGVWLKAPLQRSEYIENGFLTPDNLTAYGEEGFQDVRHLYHERLTEEWLRELVAE